MYNTKATKSYARKEEGHRFMISNLGVIVRENLHPGGTSFLSLWLGSF